MLFAVGGGGFFSSSAQGYSQGLALLFLRPRDEERPMKITPWCQYRLVEESGVPDIQLASRKNRLDHRWASFMCCGRASTGTDGPFPPKVGPVLQSESSNASLISDKIAASYNVSDVERKVCIKSSLKRASENHSVVAESAEVESGSCVADRRKVQWRDACGRELVQIREFECREYLRQIYMQAGFPNAVEFIKNNTSKLLRISAIMKHEQESKNAAMKRRMTSLRMACKSVCVPYNRQRIQRNYPCFF